MSLLLYVMLHKIGFYCQKSFFDIAHFINVQEKVLFLVYSCLIHVYFCYLNIIVLMLTGNTPILNYDH